MPDSPSPTPPARALHVLYVDDQEFLRLVVPEYLQPLGCSVETASDGLEGWQKFSRAVFDLVITDLEMPNLDGFGLIRRLRESKRPVRIIVHSSDLNERNLTELRNLSVDATLPKGSPTNALRDTVAQIVRLPS